jgi:hypothetical protein
MSGLHAEEFEPAMIHQTGPAKVTEWGKRYLSARRDSVEKHWNTMHDIAKLAIAEKWKWAAIEAALAAEGIPTALSSGMTQTTMNSVLGVATGKVAFTIPPACCMALGTAAPAVGTTGAWGVTETSNYGGYGRLTFNVANWSAPGGTATDIMTYSTAGATTFNACTSGTATELGFLICDNGAAGGGNALWYGTLTSVVISTTQTPPTLAQNALSVSLAGT